MKNIIAILLLLGAIGAIVLFTKNSEAPTPPSVPTDQNGSIVQPQDERIPSQYACVGEYCDGSMSGDDYKERFTVVQIPLVRDGGTLGCGAQLFFAPHAVPKTTAVLDATYRLLFDIKGSPEIPEDGFRNTVASYPRLFYDRVVLEGDVAKVYLKGEMYGPGHCAEPELRAQVLEAAFYYPTVRRAEVYLNERLFDWCAMDVSDGEGPCPETPQWWAADKKR